MAPNAIHPTISPASKRWARLWKISRSRPAPMSMPANVVWVKKSICLDRVAMMREYLRLTKRMNIAHGGWLPGSLLPLLLLLLFGLTGCTTGLFGGTVWEAGSLQNQHLQVLTADPNNLHVVYAGDAQDGVFASPDTGVSWKRSDVGLPHPVTVDALAFDIPGKELFAATSARLFISSDSARHWSHAAQAPAVAFTPLA